MPDSPAPPVNPTRVNTLAAESIQDLVRALLDDQLRRHGHGALLELDEYVRMCPVLLEHPEALAPLVRQEMELRGNAAALDDYVRRFPAVADLLRRDPVGPGQSSTGDFRAADSLPTGDWHPRPGDPAAAGPVRVPGYQVLDLLGRGGMGVVYRARHLALDRVVALKMIRAGDQADDDDLDRFRREAEAIARLQHPNIVQIYEVGTHDGLPYFSLEYCPGGSLSRRLREAVLPPGEAAGLVETLALGVHAAHQQGVIHRDLKPGNVLLTADGTPKIADFGLAKRLDDASPTRTGVGMGTPSYMPPEQAAGSSVPIGPAADVWALGAVLYECLTGRPPFKAANPVDTVLQVLRDEPVPPRQLNPKTPRDLETVCLKCLRKRAGDRYPSARALAEDLRRVREGRPIVARRVGRVERAVKWSRRHPARAALLGVSALALAATGAAAVALAYQARLRSLNDELAASVVREQEARQEAVGQRDAAIQAEAAEAGQRRIAEAAQGEANRQRGLARRIQYGSDMGLARLAWRDANVPRVLSLLGQHRPGADGADYRSFEWYYLDSLCRGERLRVPSPGQLAFAPDGTTLAAATQERDPAGGADAWRYGIGLWDARTGKPGRTFLGDQSLVMTAAYSDGGRALVVVDMNNVARVWDVATGRLTASHDELKGYVNTAVLSPDGRFVASAYGTNAVTVWDPRTSKQLISMPKQYRGASGGVFRPGGKQLYWGSSSKTDVWDLETGKLVKTLTPSGPPVLARAFSPDGAQFVLAGDDGAIRFCDPDTGRELRSLKGHDAAVHALAFSPDGKRLASGGADNRIVVWDLAAGAVVRVLWGHGDGGAGAGIHELAFHPDGTHLASAGGDGDVRVWDTSRDPEGVTLAPHANRIWTLAFSPDGALLASGGWDGTVKLWDGRQSRPFKAHDNVGLYRLAFSPDGKRLLTGGSELTGFHVRVWDVDTLRPVHDIKNQPGNLYAVAYSPDGQFLATSGLQGVNLWDAATGGLVRAIPCAAGAIYGMAFHPKEPVLAAASLKDLHFYDVNSGAQLREQPGSHMAFSVAYSPDGKLLAASGGHGVPVWDAATGRLHARLEGHNGIVNAVAFTPDGRRLISGASDKTVRLWDLVAGRETMTVSGPGAEVYSVAISPDGTRLAAGDVRAVRILDASKAYALGK